MMAKQTNRPPVVVILGHIDHGKSSLLEAIKDFKITSREAGGITQHIGAYQVAMPTGRQEEQGKKITFIDTPGHEAFSQMRSRGAKVADVAILVIDAAEGVKDQTKEVISLIKKLSIPAIVALNKIDKPGADPEKVKRELAKEDFLVEGMGGKTPSLKVSAKTKQGIPELLDLILLLAEMEGLSADIAKPAKGVVVESYLDSQRGPTATLLVMEGVLKAGEVIGTQSAFTRIKSLEDFQRKTIKEALPSTPVSVFGFDRAPRVGDEFQVFPDTESAQKNIRPSEKKEKETKIAEISEEQRVLNIILKADVLGSLEAVEEILKSLPQEKVVLRILKSEVGNINDSDLKLASGGKVAILGFRVKTEAAAKKMLEREKIKVMTFEIIYELVESIRNLMEKVVAPQEVKTELGKVKVLAKFLAEKNRQIIGGRVTEGEIRKGAAIEVFRNEEKVGEGKMINLQRNKKDMDAVAKGEECGILFEGDVKVEEGDILSFYKEERIKSLE